MVSFRKAQGTQSAKKGLQRSIRESIEEERPIKEIINDVKEAVGKNQSIQEQDAIVMV